MMMSILCLEAQLKKNSLLEANVTSRAKLQSLITKVVKDVL